MRWLHEHLETVDLDSAREGILDQCGTESMYLFVGIDVPTQMSSVFGSEIGAQLADDLVAADIAGDGEIGRAAQIEEILDGPAR